MSLSGLPRNQDRGSIVVTPSKVESDELMATAAVAPDLLSLPLSFSLCSEYDSVVGI